jgi:hypothetical protein
MFERAIEWIPKAEDRASSATSAFRHLHDQLGREESMRIFDLHVLPVIVRADQDIAPRLSQLAPVDMDLLVSRAGTVAKGLNKRLIDVLPEAVGRAAHDHPIPSCVGWRCSQQVRFAQRA